MKSQIAHIRRGNFVGKSLKYEKNPQVFVLRPALFKLFKSHTKSTEALDRPSLKLGKFGLVLWLLRRHGLRLGISTGLAVCLAVGGWNFVKSLPSILMEGLIGDQAAQQAPADPGSPQNGTVPAPLPITPQPPPETVAENDRIIGLVRGGVITPRGVLRKGDEFVHEGEKDAISSVNFDRGTIYLSSGKKVQR